MKKRILLAAALLVGATSALDNEAWLNKARACVEAKTLMECEETPEDGMYCLVLAVIKSTPGKSDDARVGEAVLEAKAKITAYVHGETVSASNSLEQNSVTVSDGGNKITQSYKKYEKRIKTKIEALVRGIKMVGQVTVSEKTYAVCLTCEKFEDQAAALKEAQAKYGEEDVVVSVGEASTQEMATQKAIRGALEQVLGTVVVGYDKVGMKSEFTSKVFSGTDGVVETYRILSTTDIAIGKRVEIVAKISKKKLLDNYSNYMKFLGDPAFYVDSQSPHLTSHFTEFFTDMGIRIAPDPQAAKYVIHCAGTFRPLMHPTDDNRPGVQLSLRFRVLEINGEECLIDMTNDPRSATCFVGRDPERQKELCADRAFKQMKKPLHEKIQEMVGKLVGREMKKAAAGNDGD